MRIIRYLAENNIPTLAVLTDDQGSYRLPYSNFMEFIRDAEEKRIAPQAFIKQLIEKSDPLQISFEDRLLVPIEAPEVWAAGVTYEKSKEARNYESTGGKPHAATCYDNVYDAARPELFFKSTAARTVGPYGRVYLRSDSNWQIPEPELGLVIDRKGNILGYTIGNDMSSRDIEGENPLYLPQAKIWKNSCSIGPSIRLAETVKDPYQFEIACRIYREDKLAAEGFANTGQLKRKFEELVSYLIRDNLIFDGTVLLTGTCIVPPNEFTLQDGDRIEIEISDIGVLVNFVKTQKPATNQAS